MTSTVDTARNDAERARLAALISRLSDADLTRPLPTGEWTVADTLGHLAFYDRRAQVLMEQFLREGVSPAPYEFQSLNDALLPLLRRTPPRAIAEEALAAADAADAAAARVSPELLAEMQARNEVAPDRWKHRKMHVDEIEAVFG
ncbi:MAG: maleylpyruvate isomerase N-terminal domain-containing protein [Thermomicrobiales bacterium]|nr:maleylpyruvate isomerase N-terminal domain-containing protein [Thermomicrobiales bacterium]